MPEGAAREGAAIGAFEKALQVSTMGSSLVEIRFTNGNPEVAAQAVNTLVDAFKDRHLEVFGGKSTEFLESQKKVFEEKLRESESRLSPVLRKEIGFSRRRNRRPPS